MPFPRMTARRWMLAVAVVGVVLGLAQRRADFRRRARLHWVTAYSAVEENKPDLNGEWERFWFSESPNPPKPRPYTPAEAEVIEAWFATRQRRIAYHEAMSRKYDRAARRPWLPVPPDPPEPE